MSLRVAVSGITGYVGAAIGADLATAGHTVIGLSRRPAGGDDWRQYALDTPVRADLLDGVDALVLCAWDLSLTSSADIRRVNVEGSQRLIELAAARGVRSVFVSSMSAYAGTSQLYGQAKLACEATAIRVGANAVRPGLVYGGGTEGGMIATLERLARLPVLPVIGARSHQYTVHVDDLAHALRSLLESRAVTATTAGLAHPDPVRFDDLLRGLAAARARRLRVVPIPWRPVYEAMRLAERLGVTLPLRADSVLGLVRPAPGVPNVDLWRSLAVELRPWSPRQAG